MTNRTVVYPAVYQHFKGGTYTTIMQAMHTETGETLVIYQNDQNDIFARPLEMFLSRVDKEKYPDASQEYRMEHQYDKHTFILPIGDWSKDGHGYYDDYTLITNKTRDEIVQAYHQTETRLFITFNTNWKRDEKPVRLLCDYLDCYISETTLRILEQEGINLESLDIIEEELIASGKYLFDSYTTAQLFMEFVKLSLPDIVYELTESTNGEPATESIVGFDSPYRFGIGYGCYCD